MSTPLTANQRIALVVALENMRATGCTLNELWIARGCCDWTYVYLFQWFGIVGQDSAHIPHMVNELCRERC